MSKKVHKRLGLLITLSAALCLGVLWLTQRDNARSKRLPNTQPAWSSGKPSPSAGQPSKTHSAAHAAAAAPAAAIIERDPNIEDDPQEPEVVLPGGSVAEDAHFMLGLAGDRLNDAMRDTERFAELARCRVEQKDCQALEAEAIRQSLKWPIGPELAQGKLGVNPLLKAYERDAIVDAAHQLASQTLSDPHQSSTQRVAALALLGRLVPEAPEVPVKPLPEAAYHDLLARTPAEANLLLGFYEAAPTGGAATAENIRSLALDASQSAELRGQAIRALGRAETAAQLSSVVDKLVRDAGVSEGLAQTALAPALARCAGKCASTVAQLATSKRTEDQMAALTAVAMTKDRAVKAQLLEVVVAALPAQESLERRTIDQLAYLSSQKAR